MHDWPLAYLLTFTCYGTRLHGDEAGSVHRRCNTSGTPVAPASAGLERFERELLGGTPYVMDAERRRIVLEAIEGVCRYREWTLVAAHVRPTHVHVVVSAAAAPERVLSDLKAYASRMLNEGGIDDAGVRRWAKHGSTRYLWRQDDVASAAHYVVWRQGDQLDVYPSAPELPAEAGQETTKP